MFNLYIIKCLTLGHYYVGITSQPKKRFQQHRDGRGAKYTQVHGVKSIHILKTYDDEVKAKKAECKLVRNMMKLGYEVAGANQCMVEELRMLSHYI